MNASQAGKVLREHRKKGHKKTTAKTNQQLMFG
jgi:hypothetical protein